MFAKHVEVGLTWRHAIQGNTCNLYHANHHVAAGSHHSTAAVVLMWWWRCWRRMCGSRENCLHFIRRLHSHAAVHHHQLEHQEPAATGLWHWWWCFFPRNAQQWSARAYGIHKQCEAKLTDERATATATATATAEKVFASFRSDDGVGSSVDARRQLLCNEWEIWWACKHVYGRPSFTCLSSRSHAWQ